MPILTHRLRHPRPLPTQLATAVLATLALAHPTLADDPLDGLQVPEGFTVELAAGPPLIEHPMMAGFDPRGRLFVAESAGLNLPADKLLQDPPNRIIMLEDADADGRFDKRTLFADKMTLPMGALWHQGALFVASPPSLWRLEDTDGDGVADRRDEIVTHFGFSGNAASVHGPFLGPDGLLYWNDGRHGHEIETPAGRLTGLAARMFRCRPDGSQVERVCGGGFDNPVEVAFTAEGEAITTMTFYTNPHDGLRDALVHFVEGGVYPKLHDCLNEFPRTGPLLPPLTHLGVAACSGLMRYRSTQFGNQYQGNLFSALFNMHKVQRHVIERRGATFACTDDDFLTTANTDFHPTDVLEDADGSILVINTGGWFRIGCPTSRIAKPEIEGAIYRIRRTDATPVADPRGLSLHIQQLPPDQLAALLDDSRTAVRDQAVELLVAGGSAAVPALRESSHDAHSPRARRNALWALARIATPEARAAVRRSLIDENASVRQAAARSAGTLRDADALRRLATMVVIDEPQIRRDASTALGRIGEPQAVHPLLDSLRKGGDLFQEHATIYALIRIGDPSRLVAALGDPSPAVRRGALIALDQGAESSLTRELVAPLLDTDDAELQQAAMDVISRRPGWSDEMVGLLRQWMTEPALPETRAAPLRGALLAMSRESAIQDLVSAALASPTTHRDVRLLLLEVIERVGADELPTAWQAALGRELQNTDSAVRRQAVGTIRSHNLAGFDRELLALAHDDRAEIELRIAALHATLARNPALDPVSFALLLNHLGEDAAPLMRLSSAQALASARLQGEQLLELAAVLPDAGPLVLPSLVGAFAASRNEAVGTELIRQLGRSPLLATLPATSLQRAFAGYPPSVQRESQGLMARLADNLPQRRARLAELNPLLQGGDPQKGEAVFFGKRASCSGCHRVAGRGGNVGPDLTRIAASRSGSDLLEAIAFPSASFAQGYLPYTVATNRGQVFSGILQRQSAGAVILRTADRAELRIQRDRIEEMGQSNTSIMPQGLDTVLSAGELRDLLAWLQGLR